MDLKIAAVSWPAGLLPGTKEWRNVEDAVNLSGADIIITNEMPFGSWIAAHAVPDLEQKRRLASIGEDGLEELSGLKVGAVISTRPVIEGRDLMNEAFVLSRGVYTRAHRKRYLPEEPGWHEKSQFRCSDESVRSIEVDGLRIGILICSELMFMEDARRLGKEGAHLIAVPRATGDSYVWPAAVQMASIVSGCYVVSSNRAGKGDGEPNFGGGVIFAEPGKPAQQERSPSSGLHTVTINTDRAVAQRTQYPCYIE